MHWMCIFFFTIGSSLHECHTVVLLICFFSAEFLKEPAKVLNIDQCAIRHLSRKQLCGFLLKQYSCITWLCYASDSILKKIFLNAQNCKYSTYLQPFKAVTSFLGIMQNLQRTIPVLIWNQIWGTERSHYIIA